jgi:hypothetical protein
MAQTVILKRSSVAGKVPLTTDLSLGELALNTYDGKLYTKKDDGTESIVDLSGGNNYTVSTTAPSSPAVGDFWFNLNEGVQYTWIDDGNSSQWIETGGGGGGTGANLITETAQVINQDTTLSSGYNGLSVGPVEVAATYSVTVPANSTWLIAS